MRLLRVAVIYILLALGWLGLQSGCSNEYPDCSGDVRSAVRPLASWVSDVADGSDGGADGVWIELRCGQQCAYAKNGYILEGGIWMPEIVYGDCRTPSFLGGDTGDDAPGAGD